MTRTLHIITGLMTGGAELMLYKLVSSANRDQHDSFVLSLMDRGNIGERLESAGVPVYELGITPGRLSIKAVWRLSRLVRTIEPDVIQGWMYHGNLAAIVAKRAAASRPSVIWNIRQSLYGFRNEKPLTRCVIRAGARLSPAVERIIYNSRVSAAQHEALGYLSDKRVFLPNGFDVFRFRPSEHARSQVRRMLGLPPTSLLVGLVGRYHPQKDHVNFMRAVAKVHAVLPTVHFVLAGRGISMRNPAMRKCMGDVQGNASLHLLDEWNDVHELLAGLDVVCSSSAWGEAFPNVIGEAMSCGIPCVVTDVGDSAWVLGGHGVTVPPRDSEALARGIVDLLQMGGTARRALGLRARRRIIEEFSLARVAAQYGALYEEVLRKG